MRVTMIFTFIFLLSATGTLVAQEKRPTDEERWIKARAERMTECMARKYGLSDKQKEELQNIHEIWLLECGDCPHYCHEAYRNRRRYGRGWHRRGGSCGYYDKRPLIGGCCNEDYTEDEEKYQEAYKEYEKVLKRILNKEQYKKYQETGAD